LALLVASPAGAQTKPTELPKLPGPWVLVLPDKHIFINPDSTFARRGDTISVLERIDVFGGSDSSIFMFTSLSRYFLACDVFSRNERWSKDYTRGKKPTFTNFVGTLPEWERTSMQRVVPLPGQRVGNESTAVRANRAICGLAKARRAKP